MDIVSLSLFPELLQATEIGVTGRAVSQGILNVTHLNIRDFANGSHRQVDDRPYGGGPGMVLMAEPLVAAIDAAKQRCPAAKVIYCSPQGRVLDQTAVQTLARRPQLIFLAGRYEGVDERVLEQHVDEEWSLGDYVLSGGELAIAVMIDAIARLQPGALGHQDSAEQDSFSHGLLDCPHYTRPEIYAGGQVPSVLLSGDHAAIAQWRLQQALGRTWQRRPDVLDRYQLTKQEQALLAEYIAELGESDE